MSFLSTRERVNVEQLDGWYVHSDTDYIPESTWPRIPTLTFNTSSTCASVVLVELESLLVIVESRKYNSLYPSNGDVIVQNKGATWYMYDYK